MSVPEKSYLSLFKRFLKFGFLAWGGPFAQIGMIKQELVDEEKWISKERFNKVLAVYQMLPGPEAHELCVYFGTIAKGRIGGLLAGLGFMLPGFLLMLLLSWLYLNYNLKNSVLAAAFLGMQPAVAALVVRAVHRIGEHAVQNRILFLIASLSFFTSIMRIPFWFPLLAGGLVYVLYKLNFHKSVLLVFLLLIGICLNDTFLVSELSAKVPNGKLNESPGWGGLLVSGLKTGLLTFGGAYTAIPFLRNDAVVNGGWLSDSQFLDGIALSGILPAPLIIFSTFIGYVGDGLVGAVAITTGIFLPAFAFTLIGHDLIERIIENRKIHDFLIGVTAAVVGIISAATVDILFSSIPDLRSLIIFISALLLAFFLKHRLAVLFIVLGGAMVGQMLYN